MSEPRPGILVVCIEVDQSDAEELDRWYREEHEPERLATPGFLGLRRFRAYDGSARFLAIYELADADAAMSPTEQTPESAERMRQIMEKWERWDRSVWVEV